MTTGLPQCRSGFGLHELLDHKARKRDERAHARNTTLARAALMDVIGDCIPIRNENGDLFAEIAASQIALVAGAGYGRYLTAPLLIPLGPA